MHVRWAELREQPVASIEGTRRVGTVGDPIFNPESGTLLGCWVKTGWLSQRVLPWAAVREIEAHGVVIAGPDELVHPQEVVRIENALKLHAPILGQRVVDESGVRLGSVQDVTIDSGAAMLVKLHTRNQDIPRGRIVEVRRDAVVVEATQKVAESALAQAETA